jgi:hypothetical protein
MTVKYDGIESGVTGWPMDAMFAHSPAEGTGIQTKQFGSATFAGDIPTGHTQGAQNMFFFYIRKASNRCIG